MIWQIYAFLGALTLSLIYIIEKKILFREHPLNFCTILALFSVITSFVLFPYINLNIDKSLFVIIYISSIGWTFSGWYLAKAMHHMQLSHSTPLLNFTPAVVVILAFIFLRDLLSLKQFFGIGLLVIGAYVLETHKRKDLFHPFRSLLKSKYGSYIILSIMISAVSSILDKFILGFIGSLTYIFTIQIFILINFIALTYIFEGGLTPTKLGIKKIGLWVLLLAILTVSRRVLTAEAISLTHVGLVIAILYTSTLITVIFGGKLFHEKHLLKKTLAVIIMLAGVFLTI